MIKKTTQERLLQGLIEEVNKHSHTEELLNIMQEQVLDDTYLIHTGSHL
jgi:hypothetical protein